MRLVLFASLYAVSLSAVISCSPNNESEAVAPQVSVTKPKLTKGEQVLNELKSSKISYAAFFVEPKGKYTCQSIQASVAKWNGFENYWEPHATEKIIFDLNNPAKRVALNEQLLLLPIQTPGRYAVFDMSCTPMKGATITYSEISGEFEVKAEKINYIGEFTQHVAAETVHLYLTKKERVDGAQTYLDGLDPALGAYMIDAAFEESQFINFDGQSVSFSDVVKNKFRSEDYFVLSQGLLQEAVLWEDAYLKEAARPHPVHANLLLTYYFKKKDQALERVYTLSNLTNSTNSFDVINAYMQAQLTHDDLNVPKPSLKSSLQRFGSVDITARTVLGQARSDLITLREAYNLEPFGDEEAQKAYKEYYAAQKELFHVQKRFFKNISGGPNDAAFIKSRGLSSVGPYLDSLDRVEVLSDKRLSQYSPRHQDLDKVYIPLRDAFFKLRRDYFLFAFENLGSTDPDVKAEIKHMRQEIRAQRNFLDLLRE